MSERPTMSLAELRRRIEAQDEHLREARARASGTRLLPVTRAQLRALSEACEPRTAASSGTVLREWSALRC